MAKDVSRSDDIPGDSADASAGLASKPSGIPGEPSEVKNTGSADTTDKKTQPARRFGIGPLSSLGEDLRTDTPVQSAMLANAIGGWRGIIDSSLPSLVFVIAYLVSSQNLTTAVWAAIASGVVIALWRLVRRQSLQQVLSGFAGVAISAWLASRTGSAADFFLPGLLINAVYGLAFVISNLVGWPLIGLGVGAATSDITGWRKDPDLVRAYRLATWAWAGMFFLRLVVQLPLYYAQLVGALGIAKIALGWPPMLIVGIWTYKLVRPALKLNHQHTHDEETAAESDNDDKSSPQTVNKAETETAD